MGEVMALTVVLAVLAFASLTLGAYLIYIPAGLIVAGAMLALAAYLSLPDSGKRPK
jgi:hypothetical protein